MWREGQFGGGWTGYSKADLFQAFDFHLLGT